MAKIVVKAQKEFFYPAITKLLLIYMIFAIDSLDFFQDSLHKIVIYKKNSMRILFNPVFNLPILSSSWGKNNLFLQPNNIEEDQFAFLTHTPEKIEANALKKDLEIEKSEGEIWTSLDIQHI